MNYYHDLITEKSWEMLKILKKNHSFVLIGGWAVYLYTKALKSRDIDLICDYSELEKFRKSYDLIKNDRLKKYEIHAGEFDIDIYVPFFSNLGIPVEDLGKMGQEREGFTVIRLEALLVLKLAAFSDRASSIKGEKDKLDIISLLLSEEMDIQTFTALVKKYKLEALFDLLRRTIKETRSVPELGISEHTFSGWKKRAMPKNPS